MKLDPTVMRNMQRQDFRVLEAVEKGMQQQHSLVPVALIASMASLRHGGTTKIISSLLRDKLLSHDQSCGYDGYRLTNSGYDILALHALKQRKFICALGDRIGTGKESDVYVAATPTGQQVVLKFHRLGRTSFRNVKQKRDYFHMELTKRQLQNGSASIKQNNMPNSWLFLSRLSAMKEYAFMKALHQVQFPTPTPLAHNRHVVVMSLIRGMPLYQIPASQLSSQQAKSIMEQSTQLAIRLAQHGLVHCDLNEFNLMVDVSGIQHLKQLPQLSNNNHYPRSSASTIKSRATATTKQNRRLPSDLDSVADHYVRHSGLPVSNEGALSVPAHAAMMTGSSIAPHHHDHHHQFFDGTGELITEAPLQPTEFLSNGQAKPMVILIDFPQMVSTRHANAQELYERDMQCLQRFFINKIQRKLEDDDDNDDDDDWDWDAIIPKWHDIIQASASVTQENNDEEATICLASKAQIRLDEELKASGYSLADAKRGNELYYYESHAHITKGISIDHDEEAADFDHDDADEEDDEDEDDDEPDELVHLNGKPSNNAQNNEIQGNDYDISDKGSNNNDNVDDDDNSIQNEMQQSEAAAANSRSGNSNSNNKNAVVILDLMDDDQVSILTRQVAEDAAKLRIRQELDVQKRKERQRGAFRKKNSNKSYVKGKRIFADAGC